MSLARCRYPLRFAFKLMFLFGWKSFKERRACQLIPPEGSIISLSINFGTINLQRDDAKCMATKSERNGIWYEILNVIANPLTSKIWKIYYQVRWDGFKIYAFLEASISQIHKIAGIIFSLGLFFLAKRRDFEFELRQSICRTKKN